VLHELVVCYKTSLSTRPSCFHESTTTNDSGSECSSIRPKLHPLCMSILPLYIGAIPTYRVYQLYVVKKPTKILTTHQFVQLKIKLLYWYESLEIIRNVVDPSTTTT